MEHDKVLTEAIVEACVFTSAHEAPLNGLIKKEYHKLIRLLSQFSETALDSALIEATGGLVSARDIIAYQIGWGKLLIGWYHSGLREEVPQMPGEGFSSWNYEGLARHFHQKYRFSTITEQVLHFYKMVDEILVIVETEFKKGRLDKVGVWPWCTLSSGKQWPLSKWIQVNTLAPYKRGSLLIGKLLKSK